MQLPAPVRAAIGLAANAADEARRLPNRAVEMPMLAVSTAVQMSLRAQQRYAALTARGDEVLSRAPGDEPPPWATFDDDLTDPARHRTSYADSRRAAQILEEILGDAGIAHENELADEPPPPTPITAAPSAPSTPSAAGAAADPAKKAAKRTAAKKTAANNGSTKKTAAKKAAGKQKPD